MKPTPFAVLALAAATLPCYGAMTKGHIQVRGQAWPKGLNLSTEFATWEADLYASQTATPLEVQIDLEKAQTTETDIHILNGFFLEYPFLGISGRDDKSLAWKPPSTPYVFFMSVQQTPNAKLQKRENSYTAANPTPMLDGLPYQASAIWRYEPSKGGRLSPTLLALNGTRLPVATHGWTSGTYVALGLDGSGAKVPPQGKSSVEFYFVPSK
ncbi:hypothetical protein BKA70DRAFT_1560563 [Coprinopsis sp. MPI-PUGE-AT-0042]|nr:hypothetical protein BKA70DRAFT_1560563 [Coprinopsis sp. MPI-PUGE-AT-0042]